MTAAIGIDPGNSGGPIIDESGRLVGVSVAKVRSSSIGFAIPAWKVQELLPPSLSDILLTKRPEERGYRCSVNLSGLPNTGHTQVPELLAMTYAEDQPVQSRFENGSWTAIAGLKPVRYSVPSPPNE